MMEHNHVTRDVKPFGQCPGCDEPYVEVNVTQYDVSMLPLDFPDRRLWSVTVEYRGKGLWGVFKDGFRLGKDDTWDYEPIPSYREDDWIAAHQFTLDEALALARKAASEAVATRFGLMTPQDALKRAAKRASHDS
jgi:hypothetical protein